MVVAMVAKYLSIPFSSLLKLCTELGHAARDCPQEKVEVERVGLKCFLCGSSK